MRLKSASSQEDVDRINATRTVVFTPQRKVKKPAFDLARTRWFVEMDGGRRPVSVHRMLGGTMPQIFDVRGREWDVYSTEENDALRAAFEAGLVIEVNEATATLATLDLIGGSMG
jgi:hypothetical protein